MQSYAPVPYGPAASFNDQTYFAPPAGQVSVSDSPDQADLNTYAPAGPASEIAEAATTETAPANLIPQPPEPHSIPQVSGSQSTVSSPRNPTIGTGKVRFSTAE